MFVLVHGLRATSVGLKKKLLKTDGSKIVKNETNSVQNFLFYFYGRHIELFYFKVKTIKIKKYCPTLLNDDHFKAKVT